MLFVTAPGRVRLLAGRLAALSSFAALLVAAAVGLSLVEGLLLAPAQGIDTSAWTTAEGIGAIFATYGNMTGAVITAGLLGAILAIISRSGAIAISIGTAYILIVEPLVGSFWDALANWDPSAMFSALVAQGTDNITYPTAVIVVAFYASAAAALSSIVLARRDVTS